MPTYQYHCKNCGAELEVFQRFQADSDADQVVTNTCIRTLLRSQATLTCPSRFLHACVRAPSMTWWARNTWWGRVSSCVA